MKKVLSLFIAAGMLAFMACGGGSKKAAEKAKADSTHKADSIAKVNDSIKKAKAVDSIKFAKKADSLHQDSVKKNLIKKDAKKEEKKK